MIAKMQRNGKEMNKNLPYSKTKEETADNTD
jgi:hypothetical protein